MIFVNLIWLTKIEVAIILIKSKAMFFGGWLVSFQRFQDSQHVKYKTNKKNFRFLLYSFSGKNLSRLAYKNGLMDCYTYYVAKIIVDAHFKLNAWE